MTGALVVVRARPIGRLDLLRRWAHLGLAPAAFLIETLALAAGLLVLITFAILQFDPITMSHEWGSFLTHYAAAPRSSRAPVDRALLCALVGLTGFVATCRWPAGRHAWRVARGTAR